MSGVGKTTLAYKLPRSKWFHYSGDYRIGTKYLAEPILDNIKRQAMKVDFLRDLLRSDSIYIASNITVHNLRAGRDVPRQDRPYRPGGLPVTEFKRRQKLHRDAEIGAMRDVESSSSSKRRRSTATIISSTTRAAASSSSRTSARSRRSRTTR